MGFTKTTGDQPVPVHMWYNGSSQIYYQPTLLLFIQDPNFRFNQSRQELHWEGDGGFKGASLANIVTWVVSHEDPPVFQRGYSQQKEALLASSEVYLCCTKQNKDFTTGTCCLVAFPEIQHMKTSDDWVWSIYVFYRVAESPPWSLYFFSKRVKYFIHQVKFQVQNWRLPIVNAASFVQWKCFFFNNYGKSLSVPLKTITVISSGNTESITITFKKALVIYCCIRHSFFHLS